MILVQFNIGLDILGFYGMDDKYIDEALYKVAEIRSNLYQKRGIILPNVKLYSDLYLEPTEFILKIKEKPVFNEVLIIKKPSSHRETLNQFLKRMHDKLLDNIFILTDINDPDVLCHYTWMKLSGENKFFKNHKSLGIQTLNGLIENGHVTSEYVLALCYLQGLNLEKNENLFLHHCQNAAESGNKHAKKALHLYQKGKKDFNFFSFEKDNETFQDPDDSYKKYEKK